MPVSGRNQLQDLIDSPSESLEVEYKSWLDLQSSEVKADLARHIAAMANHGGGTIIFGFDDSMQPVSGKSMNLDRDIVSGIVKHYLEPPFQCDVVTIRSRAGMDHSAIVVPPHKAVPIRAKAGGPMVNGKPKGIIQAAYYIRKTGPASEQITTANEWNPLFGGVRCMNARLLSEQSMRRFGAATPPRVMTMHYKNGMKPRIKHSWISPPRMIGSRGSIRIIFN